MKNPLIESFIAKYNVAYEDREQQLEIAAYMRRDIQEIIDSFNSPKKNETTKRSLDITVGEFMQYCSTRGHLLPSRFVSAITIRPEFKERKVKDLYPPDIYSLPSCGVRVSVYFFESVLAYHENKF